MSHKELPPDLVSVEAHLAEILGTVRPLAPSEVRPTAPVKAT